MSPTMQKLPSASPVSGAQVVREIGILVGAAAALVLIAALGAWWASQFGARPAQSQAAALTALQNIALHAPRVTNAEAESIRLVAAGSSELKALGDEPVLAGFAQDPRLVRVLASSEAISGAERALLEAGAARRDVGELVPRLISELQQAVAAAPAQAREDSVVRAVERFESRARQLEQNLASTLAGGADALNSARGLAETSAYLGQVINGLSGVDGNAGLPKLVGAEVGARLATAEKTRANLDALVARAVKAAPTLTTVSAMLRPLASDATALAQDVSKAEMPSGSLAWWPAIPAVLALIPLALLYRRSTALRRDVEQQRLAAAMQRKEADRNQEAILRLLDELSSLADGDLTVQATVTEDMTGAIADSINYAVEALRGLVTTINQSAIQLDGAARQTTALAQHLAKASSAQSKQIGSATESVAEMAAFTEEVSGNAERAADVARHSVDVAHKGGDAVRRTIDGMNTIRETIQDTSKRIKRLGESSQEIGNIVELINDIAEQTNILALNASIQASMAGEAGRGFAVVADEVQRLAERAANATKQIEVLVRTIQADTNEAVVSMERSTTDVVGGALLAENAGAALEEIEQVSNQIASLVQNISASSRQQAGAAQNITRNMQVLKEISLQTADSTSATSQSIAKLAELSTELRTSVSGFRLPEVAPPAGARRAEASGSPGEVSVPPARVSGRAGRAG